MGHADRNHALLSASGAHRWLLCTPSAKLEEQFPDNVSDTAEEGTLAHELAELKARNYFNPQDVSKRKLNAQIRKMKEHRLWDDEMLKHTDTYIDYIRDVSIRLPAQPSHRVEVKLDLSRYIPGGFGTADLVLLQGGDLYVIDFKYGKGVPVSAEKNPQLMLYALGARDAYSLLYPVRTVHLAIVQPRLDSISEYQCSVEELARFGKYVQERAVLAFQGEGDYCPGAKQCRFCRARKTCRARAQENVCLAFSPDKGKLPPLITNSEAGQYLEQGEDVAKWLSDLKDYALSECLAGREVPGWKAVEGRGTRGWTDMDKAFETLVRTGVTEEAMLWEKKPLTLAQVEKLVGKKDFQDAVGEYIVRNAGKPALVKESDKRTAITNKASAEETFREEN